MPRLQLSSRTLLVLLVVLTANGCVTMHRIRTTESADSAYAKITRRAERTDAIVTLRSGETSRVSRLQMSADSTSWWDPASTSRTAFRTAQITRVELRNRAAGAGRGALIGALSGVAFAALGVAGGLPFDSSFFVPATFFGGFGAVFGALLYGQEVYRFPAKE